jgi:tetratricopeptide (TPR) repeat protein
MNTAAPAARQPDAAGKTAEGLALHGRGDLAGAERLYREALNLDQNHADAWHLLGAVALQANNPAAALELIAQAIRRNNRSPAYYSNLGSALRRLGRLEEAVAAGKQAIALDGDFVDALSNLANILIDLRRSAEAVPLLTRVVKLRPDLVDHRLNLARAQILADKSDDAVATLQELLRLVPNHAPALINLGVALKKTGKTDDAIAAYRKALEAAPNDPGALNNLGTALQEEQRYREAEACFRQALAARPGYADAHLNLSLTLRHLDRVDEAVEEARKSLALKADSAEAHTALGFALLLKGELKEGFAEYEWRSRMADFSSPQRSFTSPPWNGEPPAGKTILVHDEQGVGDAIQFARYAPMLQARGARVIFECNGQIVRLMSRLKGVDQVVGRSPSPPPHDMHVSLLSLPYLLGTTLEAIPASGPYLSPEPEAAEAWRRKLGPRTALRVGVVWAGNPEFREDRIRSPGLAAFAPLFDVPGVEFYALQKGGGRKDLAQMAGRLPSSFIDLGEEIGNFADTAAIMTNMDLIISSCTAPPHLAGALGRPTWVVLPAACDWRWLQKTVWTPWYPAMRLFRQDACGDWGPVIERVRLELTQAAANRG